MDIRQVAETNRLRVRRDEDGTWIIPGRHGHVWEYDEGIVAVTLLDLTPKKWGSRKRACIAAGMQLQQDGEDEGTLLFDPGNAAQLQVAVKVCGIRRRRILSPAQRAAAMRGLELAWESLDPPRSGPLAA